VQLSVIIPVYNVENYLDECIQSVLRQNFTDFELLLINDGSTDKSGQICERYAIIDSRVKVFHKDNGGVSSARNLGIVKAKGEWITFIDSDDYILDNYFFVLKKGEEVDLIIQGFNYLENKICIIEYKYKLEIISIENFLRKYLLYPDFSSSCSKFFKKSILIKNNIYFDNKLSFGEDTLFNLKYLRLCSAILTANYARYCYRITTEGLSNTVVNYNHDLLFYQETRAELLKYNNNEFYNKSIITSLSRLLTAMYSNRILSPNVRRKQLKELVETNYDVIYQIYTDSKLKAIFMIAHYTGLYSVLDYVMCKVGK